MGNAHVERREPGLRLDQYRVAIQNTLKLVERDEHAGHGVEPRALRVHASPIHDLERVASTVEHDESQVFVPDVERHDAHPLLFLLFGGENLIFLLLL